VADCTREVAGGYREWNDVIIVVALWGFAGQVTLSNENHSNHLINYKED